jgi:hypothetical protein
MVIMGDEEMIQMRKTSNAILVTTAAAILLTGGMISPKQLLLQMELQAMKLN